MILLIFILTNVRAALFGINRLGLLITLVAAEIVDFAAITLHNYDYVTRLKMKGRDLGLGRILN